MQGLLTSGACFGLEPGKSQRLTGSGHQASGLRSDHIPNFSYPGRAIGNRLAAHGLVCRILGREEVSYSLKSSVLTCGSVSKSGCPLFCRYGAYFTAVLGWIAVLDVEEHERRNKLSNRMSLLSQSCGSNAKLPGHSDTSPHGGPLLGWATGENGCGCSVALWDHRWLSARLGGKWSRHADLCPLLCGSSFQNCKLYSRIL